MVSFITKLGLIGGAVSGVILVDTSGANLRTKNQQKQISKVTENFKSIEDIELFESTYGCSFAYIDNWRNKVLYNARIMLEKLKDQSRTIEEIIEGATRGKEKCKEKKGVITLNNDGGDNRRHNWAEKTDLPAFWNK